MTQLLVSWGPAILWAGFLFFLSAQSDLPGPSAFTFSDKIAHFVLYSIMGLALAWGSRNTSDKIKHAWILLVAVLFAVSDEWHQAFVPLRDSSPGDFLADVVGIFVGYAIARTLFGSRSSLEPTEL